jgi:hypothetical protein
MPIGYRLGPTVWHGIGAFKVRLHDDIRTSVVFLGFADEKDREKGIHCVGTGFLLQYDGVGYLITARHVAKPLGDVGFVVRLNKDDGSCVNLEANERVSWFFHDDENVDLAAITFGVGKPGYSHSFLGPGTLLTEDVSYAMHVGAGDVCHTVGLFRMLVGASRNLPVVHTGNISLMPGDEKVPIRDWDDESKTRWVDAYLVESQSLPGLSGSPVFVRPSMRLQNLNAIDRNGKSSQVTGIFPQENVFLLGLFQAAWHAKPSEILAVGRGGPVTVPVGMGVVVPTSKIVELLEMPAVKQQREEIARLRSASVAASPSAVVPPALAAEPAPPPMEGDERSAERFTALLDAAVGKSKQGG